MIKLNQIIYFYIFFVSTLMLNSMPQYDNFYNLAAELTDIASDSSSIVIITGREGTVLVSNDSGNTFRQVFLNTYRDFVSAEYINNSKFCILNSNYGVYYTNNAGNTWVFNKVQTNSEMLCMSFNKTSGIIGNYNGYIYYSNDESKTWTEHKISDYPIIKVLYTEDAVFAADQSGKILYSTDKCRNWNAANFTDNSSLTIDLKQDEFGNLIIIKTDKFIKVDKYLKKELEISKISTLNSFITDDNNYFLFSYTKSIDNFYNTIQKYKLIVKNETPEFSTDSSIIDTIHIHYNGTIKLFKRTLNGKYWALGTRKSIFKSDDKGHYWQMKSFFSSFVAKNYEFNPKMIFTDNMIYIGIPNYGLIYRSSDNGATWLYQDEYWKKGQYSFTDFYDIIFDNDSSGIFFGSSYKGPLLFSNDCFKTFTGIKLDSTPTGSRNIVKIKENCYVLSGDYNFHESGKMNLYGTIKVTNDNWQTYQTHSWDSISIPSLAVTSEKSLMALINYIPSIDSNHKLVYQTPAIAYSYDSGNSWEFVKYPEIFAFRLLKFINPKIGFMSYYKKNVADTLFLARTLDSGKTWLEIDNIPFNKDRARQKYRFLTFDSSGKGFTYNNLDSLYETDDFGTHWSKYYTPESIQISDFGIFKNNYYVLAVPDIIKRNATPEGTSAVENEIEDQTARMIIKQPYPIPFTSEINVPMFWAKAIKKEDFEIKVFNSVGEFIESIPTESVISDGSNSGIIKWHPKSNINTGVYFISVRVQDSENSINVLFTK